MRRKSKNSGLAQRCQERAAIRQVIRQPGEAGVRQEEAGLVEPPEEFPQAPRRRLRTLSPAPAVESPGPAGAPCGRRTGR